MKDFSPYMISEDELWLPRVEDQLTSFHSRWGGWAREGPGAKRTDAAVKAASMSVRKVLGICGVSGRKRLRLSWPEYKARCRGEWSGRLRGCMNQKIYFT
jgi:hypothetical protein